jgi:hypothetical protein
MGHAYLGGSSEETDAREIIAPTQPRVWEAGLPPFTLLRSMGSEKFLIPMTLHSLKLELRQLSFMKLSKDCAMCVMEEEEEVQAGAAGDTNRVHLVMRYMFQHDRPAGHLQPFTYTQTSRTVTPEMCFN